MKPVYLLRAESLDGDVGLAHIRREVGRFGDSVEVLSGTWLIATRLTSQQIYERLRPAVGEHDGLLVVKVTRDFTASLELPGAAWLKERYNANPERETFVRQTATGAD